jgi:O-antigen ligase
MRPSHQTSWPNWAGLTASTVPLGLLDGAAGFSYLLHVDVVKWHALVLAAKLGLLCLRLRHVRRPPPAALIMIGAMSLIIVIGALMTTGGLAPVVAAGGFIAEFVVTLLILSSTPPDGKGPRAAYLAYAAGVAYAVAASAGFHLLMAHAGRIPTAWGRYLYFDARQPNLGGEIAAAGAIAATAGLRRWRALAVLALLIADTLLLQSRAGLITEFLCVVVRLCFDAQRRLIVGAAVVAGMIAVLLTLKGLFFGMQDPILSHVNAALMMDNQYRGVGSGFSGRSALWDTAIDLFRESPIVGHGLGYYDEIDFIGPHNIVLYGLGEYGITCIPFILTIVYLYFLKARSSLFLFLTMMTAAPLFLFNDRFLDLNPYPFVLFVLLAASSGDPVPPAARRRPAGVRAPPRATRPAKPTVSRPSST